jgi:hypothetical protein
LRVGRKSGIEKWMKIMSPNQFLYAIAYCLFLVGAAKSFRENGSKSSLWIMGSGLSIDVLTSLLIVMGVKFLQSNVKGSNAVTKFAIILGGIVYILFIIALFVRKKRNFPLYHSLIIVVEIAFFIALLSFVYGKYAFPLH